jgi:uncharacterized damage-inducible protein DinB
MPNSEPWLTGPLAGVDPLVMPVFFTFAQVREELPQALAGFTREQLWTSPGSAPIGFHLKHIAGSAHRLTTYLMGRQLTDADMAALKQESVADEDLDTLLSRVNSALDRCEDKLRTVKPESMYDLRFVGRRALPTTVLGLIVHLSEHTQRHLGQAITTAKVVRHLAPD